MHGLRRAAGGSGSGETEAPSGSSTPNGEKNMDAASSTPNDDNTATELIRAITPPRVNRARGDRFQLVAHGLRGVNKLGNH